MKEKQKEKKSKKKKKKRKKKNLQYQLAVTSTYLQNDELLQAPDINSVRKVEDE